MTEQTAAPPASLKNDRQSVEVLQLSVVLFLPFGGIIPDAFIRRNYEAYAGKT
jgi:hypothetical protein